MIYIIGLGNPGEKYKNTKHNVSWIIFDELFQDGWNTHKYMNAQIRTDRLGLFIKPQTFMNKSGEVVSFLKKEVDFDPEHIVIIYDDIDLPFGVIKIGYDRGDGGHNGVKSITNHLGSKKSIRIRIGISRKLDDGRLIKPNVLGNFSPDEITEIQNSYAPKVERIIKSLVEEGREKTMNRYNTK
ncbi:MAG: aminoacyl-tRNA hydrolase [Candidatus Pacebacteria bacterium]|nr:aminoacyl-tRNA hydrolase [Candidatus Paceibacterota bacterium]